MHRACCFIESSRISPCTIFDTFLSQQKASAFCPVTKASERHDLQMSKPQDPLRREASARAKYCKDYLITD